MLLQSTYVTQLLDTANNEQSFTSCYNKKKRILTSYINSVSSDLTLPDQRRESKVRRSEHGLQIVLV